MLRHCLQSSSTEKSSGGGLGRLLGERKAASDERSASFSGGEGGGTDWRAPEREEGVVEDGGEGVEGVENVEGVETVRRAGLVG